jgi:hypothetical protein
VRCWTGLDENVGRFDPVSRHCDGVTSHEELKCLRCPG